MNDRAKAILMAVMASALLGTIGVVSRSLMDQGMGPMQIAAARFAVTAAVLGLALVLFDRGSLRIRLRDAAVLMFFGVSKVLCDILLFTSQAEADLSVSALLLNTSPYYVLAFAVIMHKEALTRPKIAAVVLGFLGCVLVSGVVGGASSSMAGIAAGASAGLLYAVYTMGGRIASDRGIGTLTSVFYMFLFGTAFVMPVSILSGWDVTLDIGIVSDILVIGVMMTLVPFLLDMKALSMTDASAVSVAMATEIVFAAVVGALAFGETLDVMDVLGIALMMLSVAMMGGLIRRRSSRSLRGTLPAPAYGQEMYRHADTDDDQERSEPVLLHEEDHAYRKRSPH